MKSSLTTFGAERDNKFSKSRHVLEGKVVGYPTLISCAQAKVDHSVNIEERDALSDIRVRKIATFQRQKQPATKS